MTPRAAILDYANEGLRGGNLNVSIKICLLYAPKSNSAKGNLCTIICSVFWLIKPTIMFCSGFAIVATLSKFHNQ